MIEIDTGPEGPALRKVAGGTLVGPPPHVEPPTSLVVIVAPSRAEQQRLLGSVPEDVAVLIAPTREHAEEILHTLPPAPVRPAPPVLPTPLAARAPLTVVADERVVCVGDRRVRLTPLEFALLRVLTSDPAHVWSFAELSQRVWGTAHVGDGAPIRAVVKRLRRKLAEAEAPVAIETVRGAGLRLRSGLHQG